MKLKILFDYPLIIYVPGWYSHPNHSTVFEYFLKKIININATFIYAPAWHLSNDSKAFVDWLSIVKTQNHTWFVACNDYFELMHMRNLKIACFLCSQNCFLDEKIYKILEGHDKVYDAIYNAQFEPFKRHHMLGATKNCALVGYGKISKYSQSIISEVENNDNFHLLNEIDVDKFKSLTWANVVEALNSSSVGLCLSDVEGAMYASVEYLLCGLPVVTTINKGGRDYLFNGRYVIHCKSSPEAIAVSVQALKCANIDPHEIRNDILAKMNIERGRFILVIEYILSSQGVTNPGFAKIFKERFSNKLLGEVVEVDAFVDNINSCRR
jgi:glycosyltransferase involved in cell wall biosynthesis